MQPINPLPYTYDVGQLAQELLTSPLWGQHPQRGLGSESPHREMQDIWVRYNNPTPYEQSGDWSTFNDQHDAIWLQDFSPIKKISYDLLAKLEGGRLGGVLLTKLPPGGKIYPHTDAGWHASYYDKYWVPILNKDGAKFCFEDVEVSPQEGEVYAFRNDVTHWVENNSNQDKISLIICIQQTRLSREGLCLGDTQQ